MNDPRVASGQGGPVADIGVVIVSYNVSDLLKRCLQSVMSSDSVQLSVCVVDNASPDDSVAMVSRDFPSVTLIDNDSNAGYPAANNQGLLALGAKTAHSPRYLLLLNPDTEVPTDGFRKLLAYMDQHRDIGVLGPKLIMPDGKLDLACRRSFPTPEVAFYRMVGLSKLFPRSPRFGRYNMTFMDADEIAGVDSVVGAFMMVRREAIDEVGLLDERFWMYGEDLDWAKRFKDAGWNVIYYPEVEVLHVKRASSRQSKRADYEFYRAMLIFYHKHYRRHTNLLMHLLINAGIGLRGGPAVWRDVFSGEDILDSQSA